MTRPEPIFVHSLHRSGSTYLFHVFRRARINGEAPYTCFQEPIHEIAFSAKDNPESLNDFLLVSNDSMKMNRHPEIGCGYFKELYDIHNVWKDILESDVVYADYFGRSAIDNTATYLQALIEATSRRTVIQECRTPLRIAALKGRLGGVHIHLWRNPWDQWWSLKVTEYFATAQQMILNAVLPPEPVEFLKAHIGFIPCPESDLSAQFEFYKARRLQPEHSYLIDFMLFMLAMIEAETAADIEINIDQLSTNPLYARQTIEKLEAQGINGIDVSDCASPQAPFGDADKDFFTPLEEQVIEWLKAGGCDPDAVERVLERRWAAEPGRPKRSKYNMRLLDEIQRRGDLVLRAERQEAYTINALNRRINELSNDIEGERAALDARLSKEHDRRTVIEAELTRERRAKVTAEAALEASRRELHHHWQLAEARAAEIAALRASRSWRLTAPLRVASRALGWPHWALRGAWAWVTLKPGSRPRRIAKACISKCGHFVWAHPSLKTGAKWLVRRLPVPVEMRLRRIAFPSAPTTVTQQEGVQALPSLSPRARQIHANLKGALARGGQSN